MNLNYVKENKIIIYKYNINIMGKIKDITII